MPFFSISRVANATTSWITSLITKLAFCKGRLFGEGADPVSGGYYNTPMGTKRVRFLRSQFAPIE